MKKTLLSLLLLGVTPIISAQDATLGTYKIEVLRGTEIRSSELVTLTLKKETTVSKLTSVKYISSCLKREDGTIDNTYSNTEVGSLYQLAPFVKNSDGTITLDYQVYFAEQTGSKKSNINRHICETDVPEFASARQRAMATIGKEPVILFQSDDLQIIIRPIK